ncbi:MAG: gliding motility-associated C-terminal domain-containing protein [Bacteroidota bacterium]
MPEGAAFKFRVWKSREQCYSGIVTPDLFLTTIEGNVFKPGGVSTLTKISAGKLKLEGITSLATNGGDNFYCKDSRIDSINMQLKTDALPNNLISIDVLEGSGLVFRGPNNLIIDIKNSRPGKYVVAYKVNSYFCTDNDGDRNKIKITISQQPTINTLYSPAYYCPGQDADSIRVELDTAGYYGKTPSFHWTSSDTPYVPNNTNKCPVKSSGTYTLNVTGLSGKCASVSKTFTISPAGTEVAEIVKQDNFDCYTRILSSKNNAELYTWKDENGKIILSGADAKTCSTCTRLKTVFLETTAKGACNTTSASIAADALNAKALPFTTTPGTCDKDGSIKIDTTQVIGGRHPYWCVLINEAGSRLHVDYSTDISLPRGNYKLYLEDASGCLLTYNGSEIMPITITRTVNCDGNVVTPNHDGIDDTVPFSSTGDIRIYNRGGKEVKRLNGPTTWDGTDNSGNALPMGLYIAITPEGRKEVTIIR